jgi:signal transduction histidine kinase
MPGWLRPGQDDAVANTSAIRSALIRFLLVALGSLVLVAIPTLLLFENIAQEDGLQKASDSGRNLAKRGLAPDTTSAAIAGDKAALSRIDAIARARMADGSVVGIRIWDLTGRVIYADDPALIGRAYPLPQAAVLAHASQSTIAEVDSPTDPGNELRKGSEEEVVEVYSLTSAITGEPLIFEVHFPIRLVNQAQRDLLLKMAPVALSALLILSLAHLPSALFLTRQIQDDRRSRQRLLVQAVAAADHERRQLAQKLHDDVIQDLAGVGYALASLSDHVDAKNGPAVERMAKIVGHDIALLRAMVTELYPRPLEPQGLSRSLGELGDPLRETGVQVQVDVEQDLVLDETAATLVLRVARECLHNAKKHARAHNVQVRLVRADRRIVLTVVDDGRGFDPAAEPAAGHFGLQLIRDTVAETGGTLLVDSAVGRGTRVELRLPGV